MRPECRCVFTEKGIMTTWDPCCWMHWYPGMAAVRRILNGS
jgi:hypothetical protein